MTSKSDGLKLLGRDRELTEGEWVDLIEVRTSLLRPHLEKFTLHTLGELVCIKEGTLAHELKDDRPQFNRFSLIGPKYDLETQGIFSGDLGLPGFGKFIRDSAFGLTRNGKWISARIIFREETPSQQSHGRFKYYHRAVEIEVTEVSFPRLSTLYKIDFCNTWQWLGDIVYEWEGKRRQLYESARELADIVRAEAAVYFRNTEHLVRRS